MTYSIVARDPATGALGVAVQSAWFGVGRGVVHARPGVGAIATQAFGETRYGTEGLAVLAAGGGADDALAAVRDTDPGAGLRQVGIVDAAGGVATHTGGQCVPAAGHVAGDGFTAQANMVRRDRVWSAMADAFVDAAGDLAARLLAALDAAEAAGGDARGRQSAALVVVPGLATDEQGRPPSWLHDLRVDDHPAPLAELRRLVTVSRAIAEVNVGFRAMRSGDLDAADVASEVAAAILPDDGNVRYLRAMVLAALGRDEGRDLLRDLVAREPGWSGVLRGYAAAGLVPLTDADIDRLLGG
jgi:uncharacterized Ntn-hydrolase superfamily protein